MQNLHWTDPGFRMMSERDQELALSEGVRPVHVAPPARDWIGMFAYHGDELRELDYPGYERQRYDGGTHLRFVFDRISAPVAVNAMGLFHDRAGSHQKPLIVHLIAPSQLFQVRRGDDIKVEVGTVLG